MRQEPLRWSADAMSWAVRRNIALDDARFIQPTLDEGKLSVVNAADGKLLNMKHPLAASAMTRGPSALGPGLSGSREYDVASPATIPARDAVDNGADFAPGQTVSHDLMRQIRALGVEARVATRAAAGREEGHESSSTMTEVSKDLRAIRGALSGRDEESASPVKHESPDERGPQVDKSDIAPPSV